MMSPMMLLIVSALNCRSGLSVFHVATNPTMIAAINEYHLVAPNSDVVFPGFIIRFLLNWISFWQADGLYQISRSSIRRYPPVFLHSSRMEFPRSRRMRIQSASSRACLLPPNPLIVSGFSFFPQLLYLG